MEFKTSRYADIHIQLLREADPGSVLGKRDRAELEAPNDEVVVSFPAHSSLLMPIRWFNTRLSSLWCQFSDEGTQMVTLIRIRASKDKLPLIETLFQYIYDAQRFALDPTSSSEGSLRQRLKDMGESKLVVLLSVCDFFEADKCSQQIVDLLSEEPASMQLSTATAIMCLPDSLRNSAKVAALRDVAQARVLDEFTDLDLAWRKKESRKVFAQLPLDVVKAILSSPSTRVVTEDTVAVAMCSWLQAQAMPPSEQEIKELFKLLRYQFLSPAFMSGVLPLDPYKPLDDFLSSPEQRGAVAFLRSQLGTCKVFREQFAKRLPSGTQLPSRRPASTATSLTLMHSIKLADLQVAAAKAAETGSEQCFSSPKVFYGGFDWQLKVGIRAAGSLWLYIRPRPSYVNGTSCPIKGFSTSYLMLRQGEFSVGTPVKQKTKSMMDTLSRLGVTRGFRFGKVLDLQPFATNGELEFTVTIRAPARCW